MIYWVRIEAETRAARAGASIAPISLGMEVFFLKITGWFNLLKITVLSRTFFESANLMLSLQNEI